jgi:hypothetical protein
MERIDKIFVVIVALGLIVFLITKATPAKDSVSKIPLSNVMQSTQTMSHMVGPAYLTSNLPAWRTGDDTMPRISVGAGEATATGATAI